MSRINELKTNALYTLREEGPAYLSDRVKVHIKSAISRRTKNVDPLDICTDVLFIPH